MADNKLEKMRQLLREENEKKTGNRAATGDKASYPYWNIPEKQTATVRFLPDQDDNNPWFWMERQTIKLPFDGVVGGEYPSRSPQLVTVPCIDMFTPKSCPIIAATRHLWKSDEELARKYWKKRSFITQGFVLSSPFEETDLPENPIRRFYVGPSLLDKLKAGLVDVEMESTPTDYLNGTDFKIKKTRKGDFNNYDTSEWSRRTRPLSESEHLAIEQFGLFNLKDFLGVKPDADGVAMLKAMCKASLDGDPFDMASFGGHYKPYGTGGSSGGAPDEGDDYVSPAKQRTDPLSSYGNGAAAAKPAEDAAPGGDPQDILAKLKAKTTAAVGSRA